LPSLSELAIVVAGDCKAASAALPSNLVDMLLLLLLLLLTSWLRKRDFA
jgi:hypothetical protein